MVKLQSLSLENFRSYGQARIAFDGAMLNVLVGRNAAGKTNVLEAVALLSLLESCRGADDAALFQWGASHYRIRSEVAAQAGDRHTLELVSAVAPRRARACFIDDVKKTPSLMLGVLPTVRFLPDDLHLFRGPPAVRRRFVDTLLCQVSGEYARTLSQYQRLLKQRGGMLRMLAEGRAVREQLAPWDAQLAAAGSAITVARLELLETLGLTLPQELQSLGESWNDVRMTCLRETRERLQPDLAKELLGLLEKNRARDIAAQATTVGPHREDWELSVDGRRLTDVASRGQERVCLLALLFLQVSYLELRRGETPVVLLDDVFSELDDPHQEALLASLSGAQVLLTTTRLPAALTGARVWEVGEGKVTVAESKRSRREASVA